MKVINEAHGKDWALYHADTVEVARGLPDASVGHSVFSPPFASLYTYSNSALDMGNCADHGEFFQHFGFLIDEQFRVMMPGRIVAIHCMQIPSLKWRDGFIGIHDFRGDIIRAYQKRGFIYHGEVTIWKDPVTAMQRTHALGLLHAQLKKDSARSRPGIPDYLVLMSKPGDNPVPIEHVDDELASTVNGKPLIWQQYASPVWMDINPSDTLQVQSAREDDDERHICPLQLEVIRRSVRLWSHKSDVVWSPFAGIGSEGFVALQEGRKFVGAELKASYFKQAKENIRRASERETTLFDLFENAS